MHNRSHPSFSCPAYLSARCRRQGKIDTFDRFILLTRNPYDAIWSEYRRTTSKVFRRDDFDAAQFEAAALKMSSTYFYNRWACWLDDMAYTLLDM